MADVLTTFYAFVKQTIGGNRNTWGSILNGNFDKVEAALSGITSKVLNGGSYTLTDAERRNRILNITGVLSSKQTVLVQNLVGELIVSNNTSGAFVLLMATVTPGNPINIPQGTTRRIWCDGNDRLYRDDAERVGEVFHHATGNFVPPGALQNTGSLLLRADYPDLFAAIGTTWGAGNGVTTFGIPNEYDTGRFRRSNTATIGVGTYQTNAFKAHTHTGSVTVSGTGTTGTESAPHNHTLSATTSGSNVNTSGVLASGSAGGGDGTGGAFFLNGGAAIIDLVILNGHTHTVSGTTSNPSVQHNHSITLSSSGTFTSDSTGAAETRPESAVYIGCIRY